MLLTILFGFQRKNKINTGSKVKILTKTTLERLSSENLTCIYGGQYIFRVFDSRKNKTFYLVVDQTGIFICCDENVARKNSPTPTPKIEDCIDINDAVLKANEKVEQLNDPRYSKQKGRCSLL